MGSRVFAGAAALSAAALLVVGMDMVTFAQTGDSVIVGAVSRASRPTTLINHGSGPVLSLDNGRGAPSLRVSSRARVQRLNADRLDGLHARRLQTRTVTFRVGARGPLYPGTAAWRVRLRPGSYHATFRAGVVPDGLVEGDEVDAVCGLADLATIGPRTRVYAADSATANVFLPAFISGSETVRIGRTSTPGFVCAVTSGEYRLLQPAVTSWTRIDHRTIRTAHRAALPGRAVQSFRASLAP